MSNTRYNVGGILMATPFKPGRLGHLGLYQTDVAKATAFYGDLLGFKISDSFAPHPGKPDLPLTFMTYGADHHAMVLIPTAFAEGLDPYYERGVTVNQMSFQVGTLAEVVNAHRMMREKNIEVFRMGRDMPGSNWAVYFRDPDGHAVELYYGMEQLGWSGQSKPFELFRRYSQNDEPTLPQPAEIDEIRRVEAGGVSSTAGRRAVDPLPAHHDVGGILLPRPFKIIQTGPIGLFVKDVDTAVRFYADELGFCVTETVLYKGHRASFLRSTSDHHNISLFPVSLREEIGLSASTSLMSYGMQLGSYQQLKDAVRFLKARGCRFIDIPADLHPGIDYAAHLMDPDGHCIQLYYYMEQIGWSGVPRPKEARRVVTEEWPESLDAVSDTYGNHHFQGPIG